MAILNTHEVLDALTPVVSCAADIANNGNPRITKISDDKIELNFDIVDALDVLVGEGLTMPCSYLTVLKSGLMAPNDPAGRRIYLDFQQITSVSYPVGVDSVLNGLLKITIIKLYQSGGKWHAENTSLTPTVSNKGNQQNIFPNESITITDIETTDQIHNLGQNVCMLARQLTI